MAINKSGDWIAIACGKGTEGQLVVWEWQSETYVMKQQSHSQFITTVAYSPDGSQIATGAQDGKVSFIPYVCHILNTVLKIFLYFQSSIV